MTVKRGVSVAKFFKRYYNCVMERCKEGKEGTARSGKRPNQIISEDNNEQIFLRQQLRTVV